MSKISKLLWRLFTYTSCLIITLSAVGQNIRNTQFIRSYNYNLSVTIKPNNISKYYFSSYGAYQQIKQTEGTPYLFNAQEYDNSLGLYLFPNRIYQPVTLKFIQPDPQSQFFSPYLFVNADPINNVDLNGKVSRPLILYGEKVKHVESFDPEKMIDSHEFIHSPLPQVTDLQNTVDAYYMPISDFVNGDVKIDLSDWNGNVFIVSETGEKGEIVAEEADFVPGFKTRELHKESLKAKKYPKMELNVKPEAIGKRLSEAAGDNFKTVKNITYAGSNGHHAAQQVADATYEANVGREVYDPINSFGLVKGYQPGFIGPSSLADSKYAKVSAQPDKLYYGIFEGREGGQPLLFDSKREGMHMVDPAMGKPIPFISGREELTDLANSRIPATMQHMFIPGVSNYMTY